MVAFAHAEIELHARLFDLVVEAKVILGQELSALRKHGRRQRRRRDDDDGRKRRVEAHAGFGSPPKGSEAHVEAVGDGTGELEGLGLEHLAGLEHGLRLFLARSVLDRFFTVTAPQRASRVQKAQQQDQPKAHSWLRKRPWIQGRAMI